MLTMTSMNGLTELNEEQAEIKAHFRLGRTPEIIEACQPLCHHVCYVLLLSFLISDRITHDYRLGFQL